MKRLFAVAVCIGLLIPQASQASPVIFDFSFTTQRGNLPGTVTGGIYGLEYNGFNQSASSVIIESYPDLPSWAYSDLIDGNDATLWNNLANNTFDVVDGIITGYRFVADSTDGKNLFALTDSGGVSSAYGAGFNFLSFRQYPLEPHLFVAASDERFSIFSERVPPSPVPIPAALPLLLSALGVFGFMGWRRKRMAAA